MPVDKSVYQLQVTLDRSKPPIWRRILVPGNFTLYNLHEILQLVMGWENYHLHMFTIDDQIYGDPEDDEYGDLGTKDETHYRLDQLDLRERSKFSYEYDFGDSWDHTILVEKILAAEKGVRYPICLKGKHACPPEDVGGVWGYQNFLEAIADLEHEEYEEYLVWIGGEFDPEAFDQDEVNQALRAFEPARGRRTVRYEPEDDFRFNALRRSATSDSREAG
ncbi:MAG: plasmid pRiA4b ORF-3 family protein [Anaerolineales bacterium]